MYNTASNLARQEGCGPVQHLLQAVVPLLAEATRTAAALHATWSGSTVGVSTGNMLGLPCFAVSVYQERTVELTVNPSWEVIFAFAVINADILLLEGHALGTWFDRQRGRHILDVVICPSSLEEAIHLGLRHRQKAIFDLRAAREIPIAGVSKSHLDGEEN